MTTAAGCEMCEGFGFLDDEDETECSVCNGNGVVREPADCGNPLCCLPPNENSAVVDNPGPSLSVLDGSTPSALSERTK
jgi:hypothetical protein